MAAGPELLEFQDHLARVHAPVEAVDRTIESLTDKVETVQLAIEALRDLQHNAHTLSKTIDGLERGLKFVGLAPPLKSATKLATTALQALEKVVDAVDAKTLALVKSIDQQKIPSMLVKVHDRLDKAGDQVGNVDHALTVAELTTEATVVTLDLFDRVANRVDPDGDVPAAVEDAVRGPNQVVHAVEDGVDRLVSLLGRVDDVLAVSALKPVTDMVGTLNAVGRTLSTLANPVNKAVKALKPIEDLLDAGGLIYAWTVEPVVDWIIDKVGLKKAIGTAVNQIKALIPDASLITKATAGLGDMFDALGGLLDDLGLDEMVEQVTDAVNDAVDSPVVIGTARAEALTGDDTAELMNALGGNDRIDAGGGDDLIVAGAGHDTIDGGDGYDVVLFRGALAEYTLTPLANGDIRIAHARPADAALSDGTDLIRGVEGWSFADGTYERAELLQHLHLAPAASDRAPAPPVMTLPAAVDAAVAAVLPLFAAAETPAEPVELIGVETGAMAGQTDAGALVLLA